MGWAGRSRTHRVKGWIYSKFIVNISDTLQEKIHLKNMWFKMKERKQIEDISLVKCIG